MEGMALAGSLIEPRSFGLTYEPPSITLVYAIDKKLRARRLGLRRDGSYEAAHCPVHPLRREEDDAGPPAHGGL